MTAEKSRLVLCRVLCACFARLKEDKGCTGLRHNEMMSVEMR